MATTLWPVIHRLSNLLSLKGELESAVRANAVSSKIAVLRTEFESTASAIEAALTRWQPHLPPNFVPDDKGITDITIAVSNADMGNNQHSPPADMTAAERGRIHSILHNALAYRHSAFVYLYRTIYAYPRSNDSVQAHTNLALTHCVATVCHAGPMGALLWPLFVAACEAVKAKDRELAGIAFAAIGKRQGMMNIERAWEIVQEVWRRADFAEMLEYVECGGSVTSEYPDVEVARGLGGNVLINLESTARRRDSSDDRPTELWRQVSKDMGVNIVFG
jgi:Fungal specific transcription factor domain